MVTVLFSDTEDDENYLIIEEYTKERKQLFSKLC